jgi:colicin import membrane protein
MSEQEQTGALESLGDDEQGEGAPVGGVLEGAAAEDPNAAARLSEAELAERKGKRAAAAAQTARESAEAERARQRALAADPMTFLPDSLGTVAQVEEVVAAIGDPRADIEAKVEALKELDAEQRAAAAEYRKAIGAAQAALRTAERTASGKLERLRMLAARREKLLKDEKAANARAGDEARAAARRERELAAAAKKAG